uniref:Phasin protein n=1 Tax=Globodera pallida TaxID=36090 RepID=A0A183CD30_GLOPA
MDTEKISETIQNMVKPENIWEMLPAHVKEMLPEGCDKIMELSGQGGPILADFLENDVWKGNKDRWEKFEGNLGEEAKQYTENIKATGVEFLSRKVFAPALRLSPEAKANLKDSLGNTLPALKPLLEKAATNKKLKEWAEQWQMMAELEAMFSKVQLATDGLKEKADGLGNAGRTEHEEGTKKEEL